MLGLSLYRYHVQKVFSKWGGGNFQGGNRQWVIHQGVMEGA